MSESQPIKMVPTKPDSEIATEIRKELQPLLDQAAEIVARARAQGFMVSFSFQPDQYGRITSGPIGVVKPL